MSDTTVEPFARVKAAPSLSGGQHEAGFDAVQEFLRRFGYLAADTFESNQLDDRRRRR